MTPWLAMSHLFLGFCILQNQFPPGHFEAVRDRLCLWQTLSGHCIHPSPCKVESSKPNSQAVYRGQAQPAALDGQRGQHSLPSVVSPSVSSQCIYLLSPLILDSPSAPVLLGCSIPSPGPNPFHCSVQLPRGTSPARPTRSPAGFSWLLTPRAGQAAWSPLPPELEPNLHGPDFNSPQEVPVRATNAFGALRALRDTKSSKKVNESEASGGNERINTFISLGGRHCAG